MEPFKGRRIPMTWMLGPSSTPSELEGALIRQGLVQGEVIPGMAIDLRDIGHSPIPSGLKIKRVRGTSSLELCSEVVSRGFGLPQEIDEGFRNLIHGLGLSPKRQWFLALLNGKPVSSAFLVLHDDAAALYCIATLPEARGKGIGTAITNEALLAAKRAGLEAAVLEASAKGLALYERMGFREICQFRTLTWSP